MTKHEIHYSQKIHEAKLEFMGINGCEADTLILPYFVYKELINRNEFVVLYLTGGPNTYMGLKLIPNFSKEIFFKCIKTDM